MLVPLLRLLAAAAGLPVDEVKRRLAAVSLVNPEGQMVGVAKAHQLGAALTAQVLAQLQTQPTAGPGCCS